MSVISNFYNAADYFAEAIDSVLAQDYRDFEMILVDDGSTDGSRAIAEDYCRRNSRLIRCVQFPRRCNRGRSAARNLGLEHARGEFVAFIDADDRWAPTKLRDQVQLLDGMPDVDAVCGSVNYWRSWNNGADELVPTGHVRNAVVPSPEALLFWYPLGRAHAPSISDLMIRIASVRAVDNFEDCFAGAYDDQAFLTKFYLQSAIYVSTEVWSDYRLHGGSCMALLISEGGYHQVRRQFLDWFHDYLQQRSERQHPAVLAALDRAQLPYRHPHLTRPIRLAGKILRTLSRA